MTFEELQEEITSLGFSNSVVNSDTFKGLTVNDRDGNDLVWVPIKATNIFDISQLLHDCFTRDEQAQISLVLEAYMATPIEKRGLNHKSEKQKVIERLTQEWNDLDEKINRLDAFKHSDKFGQLPYAQMRLLDFQDQIMNTYQSILAWRIQLLGEDGQDDVD